MARLTGRQGGNLDAFFHPGNGFFQIQLHHVADIGTATCRTRTTGPTTKDVAEDVAKDVTHVRATGTTRACTTATHAMLERGMAMLVVHAALAAIGQHFVGFLALLECRFGARVAGIAVRMVLHRTTTVSLLQLFFAGVAGHAQHFVVVAFAHKNLVADKRKPVAGQPARNAFPLPAAGSRLTKDRSLRPRCITSSRRL